MPIAVKVDEDLPAEVADLLRRAGHDARTVMQEGLNAVADQPLLMWSGYWRKCSAILSA